MTAPPVLAVSAVAIHEGCLLLVQRGDDRPGGGLWAVPGGRVEPGEPVRDAVVRELAEETGLQARCGDLVGWAERIDPDHHFVILDFRVEVADADPASRQLQATTPPPSIGYRSPRSPPTTWYRAWPSS